jgi:hypothetical protein
MAISKESVIYHFGEMAESKRTAFFKSVYFTTYTVHVSVLWWWKKNDLKSLVDLHILSPTEYKKIDFWNTVCVCACVCVCVCVCASIVPEGLDRFYSYLVLSVHLP